MIKIVVADESSAIVKAVKFAVARYAIEVVTASTGAEFLEVMRKETPDFVFLGSRLSGIENLNWQVEPLLNHGNGDVVLL